MVIKAFGGRKISLDLILQDGVMISDIADILDYVPREEIASIDACMHTLLMDDEISPKPIFKPEDNPVLSVITEKGLSHCYCMPVEGHVIAKEHFYLSLEVQDKEGKTTNFLLDKACFYYPYRGKVHAVCNGVVSFILKPAHPDYEFYVNSHIKGYYNRIKEITGIEPKFWKSVEGGEKLPIPTNPERFASIEAEEVKRNYKPELQSEAYPFTRQEEKDLFAQTLTLVRPPIDLNHLDSIIQEKGISLGDKVVIDKKYIEALF